MTISVQVALNALVLACTYSLIASGLALIFSVMRILNFAHGEFYMLGALAAYYFAGALGVNWFLSLLISMALVGLVGAALERGLWRPLRDQELPSMILSYGVMLLIAGAALIIIGPDDKYLATPFAGQVKLAGATLSLQRIYVIVGCLAAIGLLHVFLKYTKIGMALRAVAQDRGAASLQGINVDRSMSLGFGIGCALAAAAAAITAPGLVISPMLGPNVLVPAFVVVVIGGLGSVPGALIGGLILGILEGVGYQLIGDAAQFVGFIVIILLLIFKPQGVLGRA